MQIIYAHFKFATISLDQVSQQVPHTLLWCPGPHYGSTFIATVNTSRCISQPRQKKRGFAGVVYDVGFRTMGHRLTFRFDDPRNPSHLHHDLEGVVEVADGYS